MATKEQLGDRILKSIQKDVEAFIAQPSPEAEQAQREFDALEDQKKTAEKALGTDSAAYKAALKAIEKEQAKLDTEDKKGQQNNRKHAAWAIVYVANHLKLPVMLKKAALGERGGAGARMRMSNAELADVAETVLADLPPKSTKDENCKRLTEIGESTNLDSDTIKRALSKLKRDGKATSNGIRGGGGGWRKA